MQTAQTKNHNPNNWPLLLILLAGFALRVQALSFQPLWGDEGWSFYFASHPLSELIALTAVDIHPPLYYIILKGWLFLTGSNPEVARLLSVFIGLLLIPTLYVLGCRLFDDRRTATIGAAVVAVMPLAIYYSQEVRMYGLVTLLSVFSVYFYIRAVDKPTPYFLACTAAMTAALYTHYYAALVILSLLVVAFLLCWRRRTLIYIKPFVYTGLLYLPWVIYAVPRLLSYIENKRDVEAYLSLPAWSFLYDHITAFSIGHLPDRLPSNLMVLPFIVAAIVGFLALAGFKNLKRLYLPLYLLIPLFFGYVINLFFPFNPPFFERTLLLAAPAYWLYIAAGLGWLWNKHYLLATLFILPALFLTALSLSIFYTTPRYPDEDYRPLLADIAARAVPEDTVLASYEWQVGFYYAYLPAPRPHIFAVPGWGQGWDGQAGYPHKVQDLSDIFARSARLWFPAHQTLGHIWEDKAEATITELGYPALLEWSNPQTKLILAGQSSKTFVKEQGADFAGLLTLQSAVTGNDGYEAGRGIVPVELKWQRMQKLDSQYLVSLRLTDSAGRSWATRDSKPQAGQTDFADLSAGETLTDRHGLLIPAGTPPGMYRLLLSVRRVDDSSPLDLLDSAAQPLGVELQLAMVEVLKPEPPPGKEALPMQFAAGAVFGEEAELVGYSLNNDRFKAGQTLPLNLFWRALRDNLPALTVQLQLQDETGQVVLSHEQQPGYPSTNWQYGFLLRDPQDISLPATLPPGRYNLLMGLITPEQTLLPIVDGGQQLTLGTVTIIDRPHIFDKPAMPLELDLNSTFNNQAALIGLELPQTKIKGGESLPLTLYWQAITGFNRSWTVFVHLIDSEGQIISQQDHIPGSGQFPTTSWLPNEYVADSYSLIIPADTPPGKNAYRLRIGLYDANDFSRLPVTAGEGIINDHIILESWPISVK